MQADCCRAIGEQRLKLDKRRQQRAGGGTQMATDRNDQAVDFNFGLKLTYLGMDR